MPLGPTSSPERRLSNVFQTRVPPSLALPMPLSNKLPLPNQFGTFPSRRLGTVLVIMKQITHMPNTVPIKLHVAIFFFHPFFFVSRSPTFFAVSVTVSKFACAKSSMTSNSFVWVCSVAFMARVEDLRRSAMSASSSSRSSCCCFWNSSGSTSFWVLSDWD